MILFWIFIIFKLFKTVPIYFLFFVVLGNYIYIFKSRADITLTFKNWRVPPCKKNTMTMAFGVNNMCSKEKYKTGAEQIRTSLKRFEVVSSAIKE